MKVATAPVELLPEQLRWRCDPTAIPFATTSEAEPVEGESAQKRALRAMREVADALEVRFSQVLQIASFYKTFSLAPKGQHEVRVCTGMTCRLRGAAKLMAKVEEITGLKAGETDTDAKFTLEAGSCLGSCSIGPELIVDGKHYGRMTPERAADVLKQYE